MLDTMITPAVKAFDDSAARDDSVQVLPDAKQNPNGAGGDFFGFTTVRSGLLPPHATRAREYALRRLHYDPLNWMGQSAFSGLTKKWASATFQIIGKNRVDYFQSVLRQADFNRGWSQFIQKVGLNFLRYDSGAFIEVIAPGDPLRPPTGPVVGLSVLDTLRCTPTGDPDYPVVYMDRLGGRHLMHRTRVFQLVDSPDADDSYPSLGRPGYGLCALSRAVAIVSQQLHMNGYVDMKLDELPPPGYIIASNINKSQRDIALDNYIKEQNHDSKPVTGRTVWFYAVDPTAPADLKVITFSEPPENWSYAEYTELHANAWALALGVDVQELWQLRGGNLGSSQQSKVLHAKGQGKTFGLFLVEMERVLNDILPLSLELKFGVRDIAADADRATAAGLWASFVVQMAPFTSADEIRRLMAANVDAYRDAVTDTAGQIVTLGDADALDPSQIASDATPNTAPTPAVAQPAQLPAGSGNAPATPPKQLAATNAPQQTKAIYGADNSICAMLDLSNHPDLLDTQKLLHSAQKSNVDWNKPSTFHVTLAYAKQAIGSQVDEVKANLAKIALPTPAIQTFKTDTFDTPDGYAMHLKVKPNDELTRLQEAVYNAFKAAGLEVSEYSLPSAYVPHISMGYSDAKPQLPEVGQQNPLRPAGIILGYGKGHNIVWSSSGQPDKTTTKAAGDRVQFEDEFAAIVKSYQDGDLSQARARVMLRALISKYGRKAYMDGLNDGGILRDTPTRDDSKALLLLLGLAAPFLKKFLAATGEAALSPDNLAAHAASWWSKSIQPFLDQGRLTANPAQLYEFVGPDGMESCDTCQSLKGQKMSMAGWTAARLRPGTDTENFDCGGWHCQHLLVPVAKKEHAHA